MPGVHRALSVRRRGSAPGPRWGIAHPEIPAVCTAEMLQAVILFVLSSLTCPKGLWDA